MKLITNASEHNTLKIALDTYGIRNQEDVAIEEMSELTKAIIKNRRYNTDETRLNITEELADVLIMLTQLCFVYGNYDNYSVSDFVDEKINRLKQRMEGDK